MGKFRPVGSKVAKAMSKRRSNEGVGSRRLASATESKTASKIEELKLRYISQLSDRA